jgi:Arc/MetJ-type ribon-helix-helix transcriptional regulator
MVKHTPSGTSVIKTVIIPPEQRIKIKEYIKLERYRSESEFVHFAIQNYIRYILIKATESPEPRRGLVEFKDGTTKTLIKKETQI